MLGIDRPTPFRWLADDHRTVAHLNGHETGHVVHLFGVNRTEYNRLRQKGLSPFKIARRHGRDGEGAGRPDARAAALGPGIRNAKSPRGCWAALPEA